MAHFNGTIIIVDPINVFNQEDWAIVSQKKPAPKRSFKFCMINDTVWGYGDWKVKNRADKKSIGTVNSVSGQIGIFYENDILSYNPNFLKNIKSNAYTRIENFDGDVLNRFDEDKATRIWDGKGNINFTLE